MYVNLKLSVGNSFVHDSLTNFKEVTSMLIDLSMKLSHGSLQSFKESIHSICYTKSTNYYCTTTIVPSVYVPSSCR